MVLVFALPCFASIFIFYSLRIAETYTISFYYEPVNITLYDKTLNDNYFCAYLKYIVNNETIYTTNTYSSALFSAINYADKYPNIDEIYEGYYNTYNVSMSVRDFSYSKEQLVSFLIPLLVHILGFIGMTIWFIKNYNLLEDCCDDCCWKCYDCRKKCNETSKKHHSCLKKTFKNRLTKYTLKTYVHLFRFIYK